MLHSECQQIWKTQQWPQDWKRSVFISISKKDNAKECSDYLQLCLFHMLARQWWKFFKLGFSSTWTEKFQMCKLGLEKAEEPETKLPTFLGSYRKQENSRKTSTSALLTIRKPLSVWITMNCGKFLKDMGIPNHLTCLLRNLYAGQEATVKTGYGTTDWFKIGKGVCQGCILSPCLFNLFAEYIM